MRLFRQPSYSKSGVMAPRRRRVQPLPPAPDSASPQKLRRRSPLGLFLLLLLWSLILGWGLAQATPAPTPLISTHQALGGQVAVETIAQTPGSSTNQPFNPSPDGLVDVVPENLQLGQSLYLENCATCHVAMPPAVMPTESWRQILTESAHYGVQIQPLQEPSIYIVWNYVATYSRPLKEEEPVPFRLRSSRYFEILHPKVEFSTPVTVRSCATCHPSAAEFNYRDLTPGWETAP